MKRLIALALLAALAGGGGKATAQVDPRPDGLGMYFDTGATVYCREAVTGPVSLYLILTNCSQPSGISGWECHATYDIPPGCYEIGWTLAEGSSNESTAPDFVVSLATPMPNAPTMLLATLGLLIFCPDAIFFYLGPADSPSIPGLPAYAVGDDPGIMIPLHLISGNPDFPVASLNDWCFSADAEETSFGSIKALYR